MFSTGLLISVLVRAQSPNREYHVENSGNYSVQSMDTLFASHLEYVINEEGQMVQQTESQFERFLNYVKNLEEQSEQPIDDEFDLNVLCVETSEGQIPEIVDSLSPPLYYVCLVKISANYIAVKYDADPKKVEEYWSAACDLQYDIGIPAPVLMAIALKESSFSSPLFLQTGNPLGIKVSDTWVGPTFSMWCDGRITLFRKYNSAEEVLLDFSELIHSRWWYNDALACPFDDFRCFVEALKKTAAEPGYALDPYWAENILRLIEENNLEPFCRR